MTNYASGVRLERSLMKTLGAMPEAIAVARTAGSHGPFDVIAIRTDGVFVYQVKYGQFPTFSEQDLAVLDMLDSGIAHVFIVWRPRNDVKMIIFHHSDMEAVKTDYAKVQREKRQLKKQRRRSSRAPSGAD